MVELDEALVLAVVVRHLHRARLVEVHALAGGDPRALLAAVRGRHSAGVLGDDLLMGEVGRQEGLGSFLVRLGWLGLNPEWFVSDCFNWLFLFFLLFLRNGISLIGLFIFGRRHIDIWSLLAFLVFLVLRGNLLVLPVKVVTHSSVSILNLKSELLRWVLDLLGLLLALVGWHN